MYVMLFLIPDGNSIRIYKSAYTPKGRGKGERRKGKRETEAVGENINWKLEEGSDREK